MLPAPLYFFLRGNACSIHYRRVSFIGQNGVSDGDLWGPAGIDINQSNGNIVVSEVQNDRVSIFDSSGNFILKFGTLGSANGEVHNPNDVAFDSAGNLWVVDTGNDRVQKFNSSGVYQSQFGSTGTGNGQFSGGFGIALDSNDNMFVTDAAQDRVQKFNSSGVYQSQFGSTGTGNGQFDLPRHIAIDSSNNMFIAEDTNGRIQKFNSAGTYQSQVAQIAATGIALGNGKFFSTDALNDVFHSYLQSPVFTSNEFFGSPGVGPCQFITPFGVSYNDTTNQVYVCDFGNDRIAVFHDIEVVSTGLARRLIENTLADTSPLIAGGLV